MPTVRFRIDLFYGIYGEAKIVLLNLGLRNIVPPWIRVIIARCVATTTYRIDCLIRKSEWQSEIESFVKTH